MNDDLRRCLLLALGAVAGYAVLMATNPVRSSLRDGWRALSRYPTVWLLPTGFALVHAGFVLCTHVYECSMVPGVGPAIAAWHGWQPPPWPEVLGGSFLPMIESTAAIFNCVTTTFPLSALFAAGFLVNGGGYQAALFRGLRRNFGWGVGLALHVAMLLCAIAATCKPLLFFALPSLNIHFGELILLKAGEVTNWLSFLFEYLLGVSVQIYLVLLSFAWMRGLNFDFPALRRFALRRSVFVFKWAVVVMVVSSLGINLPLIVMSFQLSTAHPELSAAITVTQWTLAVGLIAFCSMQILLVFHNESLWHAVVDHARLWRRHGWFLGWLIAIGALHFFLLALLNAFLPRALGSWTWPGAAWTTVLFPIAWSVLASWLLASWVCLFRRCERNHPEVDELVRF